MNQQQRIIAFSKVGEIISQRPAALLEALSLTEAHNRWFTQMHCNLMLDNFTAEFFDTAKLNAWLSNYPAMLQTDRTIGLVLAGNIPFVGMHDLLCVLMSGHRAIIKLSSKDMYFFPWLKEMLLSIDAEFADRIQIVEKLENFDAVIATGSNNSARYFEYYFGKYPNIIRKNRTSVAIITGNETPDQLLELGKDIFYFYGLGCRNVGKLFLPKGFEVEKLFLVWEAFRYVEENNKYKNNYDYNRALLLLNQTPHLANDFFMMVETDQIFSPLASIYYEFYEDVDFLHQRIVSLGENLQCVVADAPGNTPFGKTQQPTLMDYADHVDTMAFLLNK